ncbi:MAG: guanosine monophosphate reductase [Halobacteriovoraceae bacterium]|nr:guanosine monophosphate reductase [Halobacteriovoraceae bacterium]
MFNANEICERNTALTYDDVLLMPRHCEITSRSIPNLETRLTKNRKMKLPFIAANMDTVSEFEMAEKMGAMGAHAILHRFLTTAEQCEQVKRLVELKNSHPDLHVGASVGVKEEGMRRADALVDAGVEVLTLDIAHGDSVMMLEVLDYIKKTHSHIDVIAGNVAMPDGVKRFIDHGADAVKVGIGPGSMCTTRIITGCGVPQLTAVSLCVAEARKHDIPVIADGGIKTSGDIVKAFAAGAETVMLGSMLAGCLETPGEIKGGMKKYRGMASKDAQVSWRGNMQQGMAAEGESRMIPCKGSVVNVIDELAGGVRSGMTYLNAMTLSDINKNARFMEMSTSGMGESRPHGMNS